jgi:hypothetical protein
VLIKEHHSEQNLAVPDHLLEGVPLALPAVFDPLALAKTPAIDGERDDSLRGEGWGVGGSTLRPVSSSSLPVG